MRNASTGHIIRTRTEPWIAAVVVAALVGLTFAGGNLPRWTGGNGGTPRGGDCNNDGIDDSHGIALGVSQDCDGNGVPDECDIANGAADCNGNAVLDSCEATTPHGLVGTYTGLFIGIQDNFPPVDNVEPFTVVRGRIDPTVDFDWGTGTPWPGYRPDDFQVVWTGYVVAENVSGTYTFFTRTDDGVRLFVANQLLIDEYHHQSGDEHSGTIALEAGRPYKIRMEYFEGPVDAVARLSWEPPGRPKVIIPTQNLLPYLDCNNNGQSDECDIAQNLSTDVDGDGVPDECECPADLDGNGAVDLTDLATLLSHFGTQSGATYADGDLDGDGDVDLADLSGLLSRFGTVC